MLSFGELELTLGAGVGQGFLADLRFRPKPDADLQDLCVDRPVPLDLEALAEKNHATEYGKLLTQQLFSDTALREAWLRAAATVEATAVRLRIRLRMKPSPGSEPLHAIKWESLYDPQIQFRLTQSERISFSRSFPTDSLAPLESLPEKRRKVLAVLCDPVDHEQFALPSLDTAKHGERIVAAASAFPCEVLRRTSDNDGVSLRRLMERLRSGIGILYLVCHGRLVKLRSDQPPKSMLYFEREDGLTNPVEGDLFVEQLKGLASPPLLVVLGSCHSAGDSDRLVLDSLAPKLAAAGVGAVIGLQGEASLDLLEKLLGDFFTELASDGCVDRALSVARVRRAEQGDWWRPVLYMRLRGGLLFASEKAFSSEPANSNNAAEFPGTDSAPKGEKTLDAVLSHPLCLAELPVLKERFVENYRVVFLLDWYKELHDRLQELEKSYKSLISQLPVSDDRDFAGAVFAETQIPIEELQHGLGEVLEHLKSDPEAKFAYTVRNLLAAESQTSEAVQGIDVKKLSRALGSIFRELRRAIPQSNNYLQTQVQQLRLEKLRESISNVLRLAVQIGVSPAVQRQLQGLLDLLSQRHANLHAQSEEHHHWQRVDNDLQRILELVRAHGEAAESEKDEISEQWGELAEPMHIITSKLTDEKLRGKLLSLHANLSSYVAADQMVEFRRGFLTFYSLCGHCFVKVDKALRELCKSLSGDFRTIDAVLFLHLIG